MKTLFNSLAVVALLAAANVAQAQVVYNFNPPAAGQPTLGFLGRMVPGHGLEIDSVMPRSLAAHIGLQQGDIITHIGSTQVRSHAHYQRLLRDVDLYHGGDVELTIFDPNPWTKTPDITLLFNLHSTLGRSRGTVVGGSVVSTGTPSRRRSAYSSASQPRRFGSSLTSASCSAAPRPLASSTAPRRFGVSQASKSAPRRFGAQP